MPAIFKGLNMLLLVESGKAFWLCPECDQAFFEPEEFAYGHDCEAI